MKYYSTNRNSPETDLSAAVIKGLAPDKGLYMPKRIKKLNNDFYDAIDKLTFHEIAFVVARQFFGEDIPEPEIWKIVEETLSFDTPVAEINDNIFSLELFHGPTAAFKDVGARFMARMLSYFIKKTAKEGEITVLVATSGDTGSAVANGFLGVEGIRVVVLYPKGKVSEIQEKQFTTLGKNITAVEVDGTFDDCQRLVKTAFLDEELNNKMTLTSANSINVARFLPQAFYYFHGYAQMKKIRKNENLVVCVPSGNFGNITAGLFGWRMGLPIKRFIAANNRNDIFLQYLNTGLYTPKESVMTIANAMDVGDPSNFARIIDLFGGDLEKIREIISGFSFGDDEIKECISRVIENYRYLLDPHGACAYLGLEKGLQDGETGLLLETAHPAKFTETVESVIGEKVTLPETLSRFMCGAKNSIPVSSNFEDFKDLLLLL